MDYKIETLVSGLCFTECPRWHNNNLWFSDFYGETVYRLDADNELHIVLELPGRPSGLGWDTKGNLLVVNMMERSLYRYNGEKAEQIANLSKLTGGHCNDMTVSKDGNAYIGNFGSDVTTADFTATPATLIRVAPDNSVHAAAEGLMFANGMAISNEGKTLIVAESKSYCLTAFDIDTNGNLSNRRVWAETGEYEPDGICADHKGGIWVTTMKPCAIRVKEGGDITHSIPFDQNTMACEIGGKNREYLYCCTTAHMNPQQCIDKKSSKIERVVIES
jgi:sugar lactone lactonase YvrE